MALLPILPPLDEGTHPAHCDIRIDRYNPLDLEMRPWDNDSRRELRIHGRNSILQLWVGCRYLDMQGVCVAWPDKVHSPGVPPELPTAPGRPRLYLPIRYKHQFWRPFDQEWDEWWLDDIQAEFSVGLGDNFFEIDIDGIGRADSCLVYDRLTFCIAENALVGLRVRLVSKKKARLRKNHPLLCGG